MTDIECYIDNSLKCVGLSISMCNVFWHNNKEVTSYEIRIKEKGNKEIIDELISRGWSKVGKDKRVPRGETKYKGYVYYVILMYVVS